MTVAGGMDIDLTHWPAVAVQLRSDGSIVASNGYLEKLVGREVVGAALETLLDEGSTADKWLKALEGGPTAQTLEMVFCVAGTPIAPRAFSLMRRDDDLTLVEHPSHPRLAQLAGEVESTNTDLSNAQRSLVIERARLAAALKELERSNQALDEFAHAVSHDLKAPLRAMKDAGEILGSPSASDDDRAKYAARIVDLVGRMRRMIDGVFEYARAGRSAGSSGVIDTRRAIEELVQYLNPPESIHIAIDPALPTIVGERVPFDQVMRNLLSNAFTYRRGEGARVDVTARAVGDFVEISVTDNGPGISEGQQVRIWRLFQTSRPGEGTGIGLAVVKRLVEAQGGTIIVDSVPGIGSSFRVRWPMKPLHLKGASRGAD